MKPTICSVLLLFVMLGGTATAQSQNYADIVTYNLLDFSGSSNDRLEAFRTVFADRHPDVIVAQQMNDQQGVQLFLDSVLNIVSSGYAAAPFHDGPGTDNALFYRTESVTLLEGPWIIPTELRDIARYTVQFAFSEPVYLYSMHLKAGSSTEDKEQRGREARALRNHLDSLEPNSLFLLLGTLNVYNNDEEAYTILRGGDIQLRTYDVVVNGSGNWHDKEDFAHMHTQSTRVRSFGGGASGGLDDRFDFILFSGPMRAYLMLSIYSVAPYPFGNDGQHLNDSINAGLNENVSPETAQALHDASDHLPVYTRIGRFQSGVNVTATETPNTFRVVRIDDATAELVMTVPNPGAATVRLYNTAGQLLASPVQETLPRGTHSRLWNTEGLTPGLYLLSLETNNELHTVKVVVQ